MNAALKNTWRPAVDPLDARGWNLVYEDVLAQMGLGVVVCDPDLRVVEMSPMGRATLERMAGERASRRGEPLPALLHDRVLDALQGAPNGQRKQTFPVEPVPGRTFYVTLLLPPEGEDGPICLVLREQELREQALVALLQKHYDINFRESQIVSLVRQGLSNRDIANRLGLSEGTIKNYLHQLYQKLGIRSRAALAPLIERLRTAQST